MDLCNFPEPKHPNANRIKEACIESLFEEKWDKLKKFGIERNFIVMNSWKWQGMVGRRFSEYLYRKVSCDYKCGIEQLQAKDTKD